MNHSVQKPDLDDFALVSDFRIWPNHAEPGGIILGSLDADKYIFVPACQADAFHIAMEHISHGEPPEVTRRLLLERGWDLEIEDLMQLLYFKHLATVGGRRFEGRASDFRLARMNDETFAFSKKILAWNPRRSWLTPRLAGKIWLALRLSTLVLLAAIIVWVVARSSFVVSLYQTYLGVSTSGFSLAATMFGGLILVAIASFFLHEFGHVLVARKFGIYLRSVQWKMYRGFQSMIVVQLPGIPTLPVRQQLSIAVAGPVMNIALGVASVLLYLLIPGSQPLRAVLSMSAVGNILMGVGNMNPFFPTDGYRFFSLVIFKNPDIKAQVVNVIRSQGVRSLALAQVIYLGSFFVASLVLMMISVCFSWMVLGLLFRFLPSIGLLAVRMAISGLIVFMTLRSTIKFFRAKP